jgi:repressor LexA
LPFALNIRALREREGLTQEQLALALGVSKSAISMYEQGNRQPDFETLEAFADFFNVDMNALLGKKSPLTTESIACSWGSPILNAYASAVRPTQEAACAVLGISHVEPFVDNDTEDEMVDILVYTFPAAAGIPILAENDYERVEFPKDAVPAGADFGIRIKGDSMEPTINDESIVFVRKQPELLNGQIGVFMIDDEAVCKRFYRKGNSVTLKSDNAAYQDIEIKEYQRFYIAGKVLGYR